MIDYWLTSSEQNDFYLKERKKFNNIKNNIHISAREEKPGQRLLTANVPLWRDGHRRKTLTLNCSSIVKCRRVGHHYAIVGPNVKREHNCPRVILRATKWTWVVIIGSPCWSKVTLVLSAKTWSILYWSELSLDDASYSHSCTQKTQQGEIFLSTFQIPQEIKLICLDTKYICIAVINGVKIVLYTLFIIPLERFFFDTLEWKRGVAAFTFLIRYDFTRLT